MKKPHQTENGFTLVELLVVITVIGILSSIVISSLNNSRKKAFKVTTDGAFKQMDTALQFYLNDTNGTYPPDVSRDLPAEIKQYLGSNDSDDWPSAPWPGSVFDWDNWNIGGENVVQISVRFCPAGGAISTCKFPAEAWAEDFDVNSAYYYCIKGSCRSHVSEPISYPGYCVNCGVQP